MTVQEITHHNYENVDLRTKASWVIGKPGNAALEGALAAFGQYATAYNEADTRLRLNLTQLGVDWRGGGAEAATASLGQAAVDSGKASEAHTAGGTAVGDYGTSFEEMRRGVHYEDPNANWAPAINPGGVVPGDPFTVMDDHAATMQQYRNLDTDANRALYAHEQRTRELVDRFPVLDLTATTPAAAGAPGATGTPGTSTATAFTGGAPSGVGGGGPAGIGVGGGAGGSTAAPSAIAPGIPLPRTAAPGKGAGSNGGGAAGGSSPVGSSPVGSSPGGSPPGGSTGVAPTPGSTGTGTRPTPPVATAPPIPNQPPTGRVPLPTTPTPGAPGGGSANAPVTGPWGNPYFPGAGSTPGPRTGRAPLPNLGSAPGIGGEFTPGLVNGRTPGPIPNGNAFAAKLPGIVEPEPVIGSRPPTSVTAPGTPGTTGVAGGAATSAANRTTGHSGMPFMGGGAGGGGGSTERKTKYWIPTSEAFDVPLPPHVDGVIGADPEEI